VLSKIKFLTKKIFLSAFAGIAIISFIWYQGKIYSQSERYYGQKVTRIDFKGNDNIKSSELMNLIQLRPGMILNREMMNNDLKAVLQHGSIAYAKIEGAEYKDGVSITFLIEERPILTKVSIKGLKELSEATLVDGLPLKVDKVYTESLLKKSIDLIISQAKDKGLFNVAVRYEKLTDGKKKNSVIIIFTVDEGEEIKVGKINIIGIKNVDVQSVYSVLKLEEDGIFTKGEFKEHVFEKDKELIIDFLNQHGYLDARIVETKKDIRWVDPVKKDKRVIIITYQIDEGEIYYFNGYDVQWDNDYLNPETQKAIFTKKEVDKFFELSDFYIGSAFDQSKFVRDRGVINFMYNEKGYIYARSIPERTTIRLNPQEIDKLALSPNQVKFEKDGIDYYNIKKLRKIYENEPAKRNMQFIHTKFLIQEGIKGYIESIIIKGNEKTLDRVIRREILVKEGDLFNAKLVQRSREKINNLGYFKEVNLDARPGSKEGLMGLVISVEEQLTGSMSVGGGYGTVTGFSINMSLSEKNLNGTGQQISSSLEFGLKRSSVSLSWTEPWIFNKPWGLTLGTQFSHAQIDTNSITPLSGQAAVVNANANRSSTINSNLSTSETAHYDHDSIGVIAQIGHRLALNWSHYHGFNPSVSNISNPSSKVDDLVFLESRLGWQFQNKFINGIIFDNRDDVFNTTQGLTARANVDFVGGALGGSDHYNRYGAQATFFWWPTDFTLFNLIRAGELRRWRFVFEHHLSGLFTQQTNPVYGKQDIFENPYIESFDRLFLGGLEGVRGYGAYDPNFPIYWNTNGGGSHRLLFDSELRVPIEPSIIWMVLFFDMGALFNEQNQYYTDATTPQAQIDAIKSTGLTFNNLTDPSYYRYSWGFGFRLQIPVMPIRLYLAQRLFWDKNKKWFINDPNQKQLEVVFAIGDYRF